MTRDEITALRLQVCGMLALVGPVLDSLQLIDEARANPGNAFADGVVIAQHLDEAAELAETFAAHADAWAKDFDRAAVAQKSAVEKLERSEVQP